MRLIVLLLLGLGIGVTTSLAQQFRVVTWQLNSLSVPSVITNPAPGNPVGDEKSFTDAAEVLSGTDADVIILYGVPNSEAARKIAGLMKGRKYSAVHHTAFRHGPRGNVVGLPVAILSRRERLASKNVEWTHTGRIENMPGGFGFAAYRHGPTAFCVYVAGLPGSLTNNVGAIDGKYFSRKRVYAAQYLAHHASWLATTFTNPAVAAYITGDFQLTPKAPVSDESAKILEGAGFRPLSPGVVTDKSTISVTNNASLDRVQDPIFTKGMEFIASRLINRPAPELPIVVCDLTFRNPATASKPTAKPPAAASMTTKSVAVSETKNRAEPKAVVEAPLKPIVMPALIVAPLESQTAVSNSSAGVSATAPASTHSTVAAVSFMERGWLSWALAGALGVVVLIGVGWKWSSVRRNASFPTGTPRVASLHLEIQPALLENPSEGGNAATLHALSTATGQTDRVPWESEPARPAWHDSQALLTPQLKKLMRDATVAWLARQRTQLLESHDRGTDQVLELHARVEKIKGQFQERMQAQQQRISELDTALRKKEKIIREFIRGQRAR